MTRQQMIPMIVVVLVIVAVAAAITTIGIQMTAAQILEEETAAEERLDKIINSIQTQEGLDELNKCGYVNGTEAIKVLECYEGRK
jgi:Na+-translocating ferredoxin:NAD+ oxidoreductase RnfG subunit